MTRISARLPPDFANLFHFSIFDVRPVGSACAAGTSVLGVYTWIIREVRRAGLQVEADVRKSRFMEVLEPEQKTPTLTH